MGSSIARALFVVTAVSSLAAFASTAISACSGDRPPVGSGSFTNGDGASSGGGGGEGGGGGVGLTILDAGGYCRDVDGAAQYVEDPELSCMCLPANVGELTVTLPCGYAFCDEGAGESVVCGPDQVVSFHSGCPSPTDPQDWIPSCVVDGGSEAGSDADSDADAGSDAPSDH